MAGSESTDTIEWQKTFNVKKIRFAAGPGFLTYGTASEAGTTRNNSSNSLVFLSMCLDRIEIFNLYS